MDTSGASSSPAASNMEMSGEEQQVYDPIEYESDNDNPDVPEVNLELAARFMAELFSKHDVEYAVMGGFSLRLRGSTRKTVDVDVGVNLTGRSLWHVLAHASQRLIIPNTKKISGVVRVFVKTGPTFGDRVLSDHNVSVDLLLAGFGGCPRSDDIASAREQVGMNLQGEIVYIWILNIKYMLKAKLASFESRVAEKDFFDILFLVRSYPKQVADAASSLNEDQRRAVIDNERLADIMEEEREQIAKVLRLI